MVWGGGDIPEGRGGWGDAKATVARTRGLKVTCGNLGLSRWGLLDVPQQAG